MPRAAHGGGETERGDCVVVWTISAVDIETRDDDGGWATARGGRKTTGPGMWMPKEVGVNSKYKISGLDQDGHSDSGDDGATSGTWTRSAQVQRRVATCLVLPTYAKRARTRGHISATLVPVIAARA